ncbi:hypothetical protein CYLTODRAFT_447473 [Cylindrobasidium torrendii FP15055 ss-10]|uniref:F-box domain-containing protein n=1 Tax=Cylindrobasidium torrendii FP15055 ss-10 TaxID=1314674 RepID=A0A0D7AVQ4_9AGAR|nr:hypothetical protein CYLTODRAFT_447473 [Cylindrobasidium torrendii FP15055 ss-10]
MTRTILSYDTQNAIARIIRLHSSTDASSPEIVNLARDLVDAGKLCLEHKSPLGKILLWKKELGPPEAAHRTEDDISVLVAELPPVCAPMRWVPDDILAEIFLWCAPWTRPGGPEMNRNSLTTTSSFDTTQAPWVLTCVCRRWRHLAHSLSRLWRVLYLPLHLYQNRTGRRLNNFLRTLLSRTKGAPIQLFLESSGRSPAVYSILLPAARRLQYLHLSGRDSNFMTMLKSTLPNLEHLYLDYEWKQYHPAMDIDAPSLVSVSFRLRLSSDNIQFPWSQLLAATFKDANFDPVVAQMVNLEELRIFNTNCLRDEEIRPFGDGRRRDILPQLKFLLISDVATDGEWEERRSVAEYVFQRFQLPALEVVTIESSSSVEDLCDIPTPPAFYAISVREPVERVYLRNENKIASFCFHPSQDAPDSSFLDLTCDDPSLLGRLQSVLETAPDHESFENMMTDEILEEASVDMFSTIDQDRYDDLVPTSSSGEWSISQSLRH